MATKRIDYNLPPKFISNIDFIFKIDESIIGKEEAQILYDQMRHLTKEYRSQAMSLYLQSITREREILTNEIKTIIEGFPRNNDTGPAPQTFKRYNELREKRFHIKAEQSIYFLEEQRVEGEIKDQEQTVAQTLPRSLGEDFSLQI